MFVTPDDLGKLVLASGLGGGGFLLRPPTGADTTVPSRLPKNEI